jgi:hypothetical protein
MCENWQILLVVVPEFMDGHGRMCTISIGFQCFQFANICMKIVSVAQEFSHGHG